MSISGLEIALSSLLGFDDVHVKKYAVLAQTIKRDLEAKKLTDVEFAELMSDLEGFKSVINTSAALRLDANIRTIAEGLIELAKICKPM